MTTKTATVRTVYKYDHDRNLDRVIVGFTTGDSDEPGVVEDLDDVIVFDRFADVVSRFPRYGSVDAVTSARSDVFDGAGDPGGFARGYFSILVRETSDAATDAEEAAFAARREADRIWNAYLAFEADA